VAPLSEILNTPLATTFVIITLSQCFRRIGLLSVPSEPPIEPYRINPRIKSNCHDTALLQSTSCNSCQSGVFSAEKDESHAYGRSVAAPGEHTSELHWQPTYNNNKSDDLCVLERTSLPRINNLIQTSAFKCQSVSQIGLQVVFGHLLGPRLPG